MKLIFTKSSQPLSKLIRAGLNEPVSHFGIVFDNGIVFHSNLLGTHVEWYKTFTKHCDIVYQIEYAMTLEQEEAIYQTILNTYDELGYDFGALFYFAYRVAAYKFFSVPMPSKNEWSKSDKFLCTELAGTLPNSIVPASIKTEDLSIVSPYSLYLKIKASLAEKDNV